MKSKKFIPYIIAFVAPGLIIYLIFMIIPLFDSIRLGFFSQESQVIYFSGFSNYKKLFFNPIWFSRFWNAFRNSMLFFIINMFIQNPLALMIAAILSNKVRGNLFYRTIFFAPATLSLVVVTFIWKMLLNPLWGIIEPVFNFIGLPQLNLPYLGLESTALITLALISSWQYIGIPISLYFASLVTIPDELIEAGEIDGASKMKIFWKIKFPLVLPMVGIVSLMTFIANFSAFDVIYAAKGGFAGPNFSTDTMMTLFFRTFFGYQTYPRNPYMGAAIAGTTMVVLLVSVLVYFGWRKHQEIYEL